MATIGTFTKNADGSFLGSIMTLSVQAKNVKIVPDGSIDPSNRTSSRSMRASASSNTGRKRASSVSRSGWASLGSMKLHTRTLLALVFQWDDEGRLTAWCCVRK